MKYFFLFLSLCTGLFLNAQSEDSVFISRLFEEALAKGKVYDDLRILCKTAGPRISGSEAAKTAVDYTHAKMQEYDFDTVFRQEVMVPRWERGKQDSMRTVEKGGSTSFPICALGGSVGGNVEGEVIEVLGWTELKNLDPAKVKGKIVFFNRPMDPRAIQTFNAYGTCVDQRVFGAIWAAQFGAKGIIVRSMNLSLDDYPHTGSMAYSDTVNKIPAVAISTNGAELLSSMLKENPSLKVKYTLECKKYPDALSHNVIGQLNGSAAGARFIAIGGHLDAWDLAEGAHDDGAGCIQSIEVLRLLKTVGYRPKQNIRAVMWMNEENGLKGALKYAELAKKNAENHLAAIEADRGAFAPRGFFVESNEEQLKMIQNWLPLFENYGIHVIKPGGAGADVSPMKNNPEGTILIGFIPDSQRYFDFHHAASDTFESVNRRELELGAAALAAMVYLIDKYAY